MNSIKNCGRFWLSWKIISDNSNLVFDDDEAKLINLYIAIALRNYMIIHIFK